MQNTGCNPMTGCNNPGQTARHQQRGCPQPSGCLPFEQQQQHQPCFTPGGCGSKMQVSCVDCGGRSETRSVKSLLRADEGHGVAQSPTLGDQGGGSSGGCDSGDCPPTPKPCQVGIFPAEGGGCGARQYGGRGGCGDGSCGGQMKAFMLPKPNRRLQNRMDQGGPTGPAQSPTFSVAKGTGME
uniref:Uncharacterized protein n=1 Tax=Romanomermis culicivorax TaxID=13658 RepID=A0A915HEM5_ROMCU